MKRGWFRPLVVTVGILVSMLTLVQLAILCCRPMFSNQLVMHDGLPFFHWWPQGPYCDERGNAAVADYHRNLLAVFLTANGKLNTQRFWYPRSTQGGIAFPSLDEVDGIDFFVPKSSNTLYVFAADGTRKNFPLAVGESARIHQAMRPWPDDQPDLVRLLQERYSEKHTSECSASLRATIERFARRRPYAQQTQPVR
jgi:hypothetical protein